MLQLDVEDFIGYPLKIIYINSQWSLKTIISSEKNLVGATERMQTRATPPAPEDECALADSARGGREGCRALRASCSP